MFFFQAEDGIRDLVRSRGLGDVYKRQRMDTSHVWAQLIFAFPGSGHDYPIAPGTAKVVAMDAINHRAASPETDQVDLCLLYTSDAADERSSVDLGGRRIIKKKKQ